MICEMYKISNSTFQRLKKNNEEILSEESNKISSKDPEAQLWSKAKSILEEMVLPT